MSNRAKRVSGQPRMDELLALLQGEWGDGGYNGPPTPQGPTSIGSGGSTYVRWGRTVCPTIPGTSLVYSGYAAGGHYYRSGSGANYICLSQTPEYLEFSTSDTAWGLVYGAEYESYGDQPYAGVDDQDVPCVVCHVAQRSVLMIPGQYTCPTGWTREYYGYLVSEGNSYYRSTYECMDVSPEVIAGGDGSQDQALFYHVEARCGSLPCPPYENTERELTCAVCSK